MTTLVLLVLTLAWGAFAWRHPRQAILWFPALLPAYVIRWNLGPLPTTLLELVFGATLLGVTIKLGLAPWRTGLRAAKPWLLPAGLWVLATLIAILVAPDHLSAIGLWRAYVLEPLLYFILLLTTLKTTKDGDETRNALIIATSFIFLWALIQFITGLGIPHPWDTLTMLTRRATGPFPFPNALALFAAPIASLCFARLVTVKMNRDERLWTIIGCISGLGATLLAKSIGGFIAISVSGLIVLVWNKRTRKATLLVAALIAIIAASIPQVRTPIIKAVTFKEWSGQVRLIIWNETTAMLKDHPVLGAGFGAYPDVIKPYHAATFIEIFQYPHNILLNLWSETGVLGIFAFAWIVVVWIRQAKRSPWMLVTLIALLVHGLVDVPYFKNDLAFLFWILAALTHV